MKWSKSTKSYRMYWNILFRFRFGLVWVLFLAFLTITLNMTVPLLSKYLVDNVILNESLDNSQRVARLIYFGLFGVCSTGMGALLGFFRMIAIEKINNQLTCLIFRKVVRSALYADIKKCASGIRIGNINTLVISDIENLRMFFQVGIMKGLLDCGRLLMAAIVVFLLNWQLAILSLLLIIPFLIASMIIASKAKVACRKIQSKVGEVSGSLIDLFRGLDTIKLYRQEGKGLAILMRRQIKLLRERVMASRFIHAMNMAWAFLVPLSSFSVIIVGGILVIKETASLGDVVSFSMCISYAMGPILALVNAQNIIQNGIASIERISDFVDAANENSSLEVGTGKVKAKIIQGEVFEIGFSNVSIGYDKDNSSVIKNASFNIPEGTRVALVGRSGSGKSTLIKALMGFIGPTSGEIMLNGKAISGYVNSSYRSLFGMVQQDVFIFDGSIRHNISMGKKQITNAEIRHVAVQANLLSFVEKLPKKFDTIIGEGGLPLSGGEKQRIAIARMLLIKPKILLLDEATTGLDKLNERSILDTICKSREKRTVIIVTHNENLLSYVDMILRIENGEVIQEIVGFKN